MVSLPVSKSLLVAALCLALVGCKSDTERADEYFRSGMELLEAGDADRAILQFRNVFEFEENHLETRMAMGNLFLEQNNPGAAYRQFLRVAEQYPEEFEARRALAELAFVAGNWDEFTRHGAVAVELNADDPRVQVIDLGMKYRGAVQEEDDPARQALVAPAEALLTDVPENQILNLLLVDSYVRDGAMSKALARLDVLIELSPENRQLYTRRLALLSQMQDIDGLETQLRDMVARFPGDEEVQGMVFRYYVSQQRLDDAEAFLREISDPADEDPGLFLSLISFISQVRGEEAARAEIEQAIAKNPKPNRFKAILAMLDFQAGEQEQAIADLETILADADPTLDETHTIKVNLARMLVGTGNEVGARRQIEEVLAQNPSNVGALKMQAGWQLQADETDAAIANLRVALDTAPEDVQVMNLMYEAYTRTGETDLARGFLAQAVEASGNAPEASLRYARVLIGEGRLLPAEDVLLPALQQNPGNMDILTLLGQLYLRMDDIPRATQVIDTLRRIDTEEARTIANGLQADVLSRESGNEEALTYLENLANSGEAGLRDQVMLLTARLQMGEIKTALEIAQRLVAENPDNLALKQALASTQMASGDLAVAETTFREITEAAPQAHRPWLQLVLIARRQGDAVKSDAVIDEALVATNNNANIMWAKASVLETAGDIDGAIAIYEDLYAQHSGSVVVANNLASLLATYKDDAASLERAWIVARRLRDVDNPALQDTYGWILFRRGEVEAAVPYLEKAAASLPKDPLAQVHLGSAYAALDRNQEALEQMQKAVDVASPVDTRPQIEKARGELTRLRSLVEQ